MATSLHEQWVPCPPGELTRLARRLNAPQPRRIAIGVAVGLVLLTAAVAAYGVVSALVQPAPLTGEVSPCSTDATPCSETNNQGTATPCCETAGPVLQTPADPKQPAATTVPPSK